MITSETDGAISLLDIAFVLGSTKVTARELSEQHGLDREFIEQKIGVRELHWANADEPVEQLAVNAAKALLSRHPGLSDKIGVLVVCSDTWGAPMPHLAAIVQDRLGLSTDTATFDINLACSGFVYSLAVLKSFMAAGGIEHGLLITADTISHTIRRTDRTTGAVFSDAASATLLGHGRGLRLGKTTFGTDGSGGPFLTLRTKRGKPIMRMHGKEVFDFAMQRVPTSIDQCLARNALGFAAVDLFVLHQANSFMLKSLARRMGIADGRKFTDVVAKYGNTMSGSIPIALRDAIGDFAAESRTILVCGFGAGFSWATSILTPATTS